MTQKLRLLTALSLAVFVLTPLAFSAPIRLGTITLNESQFEKFGALYFPFQFNIPAPLLFVLCENGVNSTGCVNNIISDVVCVNNNQAGEGVTAMISDQENSLSLGNLPPDFPCPPSAPPIFVAETGKPQVLSGKKGIPTILPTGPGPLIKVTATSELDTITNITSDVLVISTQ